MFIIIKITATADVF